MPVTPALEAAIARSKSLPTQPTPIQLEMYALYKQAAFGDATGERPSVFDPRARAKWDAWKKLAGMTPEAAEAAYIALVARLAGT